MTYVLRTDFNIKLVTGTTEVGDVLFLGSSTPNRALNNNNKAWPSHHAMYRFCWPRADLALRRDHKSRKVVYPGLRAIS